MTEELYSKKLPLTIRIQNHEDRKASVQITILSASRSTGSLSEKEYIVRLTDDKDPFFLFILHLGEDEFKKVKTQQNLNVDFTGFPKMVTHLFDRCLEEKFESPKYFLQLLCSGPSMLSNASFNIVESNMFQDITYLSLSFLPASDSDVKRYLADGLKILKEQYTTLLHRHEFTEVDLNEKLRQAREALSSRTEELSALKANLSSKINEMSNTHGHEMNLEKDKALQLQTNLQQRYEREKKDLEQAHLKLSKQTEARCQDLEAANKELTEFKYKAEANLRELKSKLNLTDGENLRSRQDVQNLQTESLALQSECHEKEKMISQLRTRVAVFEQEIKDKDEIIRKNSELFDSEQSIRKKMMEELEQSKQFYTKEKGNRKKLSAEIQKGNDIIKKFQAENLELVEKIRIRTQIALEQEKLLKGKQLELEKTTQELENFRRINAQLEDDKRRLNESFRSTLKKLEDSQQLLQSNEQLISYLNKRLTETQIGQLPHSTYEVGASFGPTSGGSCRPSSSMQKAFGSSSQSASYILSPHTSAPTGHPVVHYQELSRSNIPVPSGLGKGTTISNVPFPEEQRNINSSSSAIISQSKSEDLFLDPKYLQPGEGTQIRPAARVSSPPIHFPSTENPNRPVNTQSSRNANKQSVAFVRSNETSKFPQPSLASSYFPSKPT